jgi:hypothetical protein
MERTTLKQLMTTSWVIVRKADGDVLFETYNRSLIAKLNTERYEAIPILQYLYSLNRRKESHL